MDIQHIKIIAKELQGALPFNSEGISSEEQYTQALALADEITDNDKLLSGVLSLAIEHYETIKSEDERIRAEEIQRINDEDAECMRDARKKMDALCDTPDGVISFKWYEIVTTITIILLIITLTKTFLT